LQFFSKDYNARPHHVAEERGSECHRNLVPTLIFKEPPQVWEFKVLESDLCLNPEEIITNLMIPAKTVNEKGNESEKWILGIRICRAGGVPQK